MAKKVTKVADSEGIVDAISRTIRKLFPKTFQNPKTKFELRFVFLEFF